LATGEEIVVIARLCGGLGNQLFIYAAARRLSLKNNVPLILDAVSGFSDDFYRRNYCLHHFNIKADFTNYFICRKRFSWLEREIRRKLSTLRKIENRSYIIEEIEAFDSRIYNLQVKGTVYLDGYWQSEKYFKDIEDIIRQDLEIITEHDEDNIKIANEIKSLNAVCLHARRLHGVPNLPNAEPKKSVPALPMEYYRKAIELIARRVSNPVFFCFGDYPQWLVENIKIDFPTFIIDNNKDDEKNYEDLWLMRQCKHFILANSTFSWWGAWLSNNKNKIVIARQFGNRDCIPNEWITI
jgi:hypothetical protein